MMNDIKIEIIPKKYICKICEEEILEEENKNECKICNNYFFNECIFSYIKETIKNGKYIIKCPDSYCDCLLSKEIIDKILSFNNSFDFEVNNLKYLLEKNKTKEIVLSNPDLMFCPIANCEGYCNKKTNKKYNICNKGHKFCPTCGELYHKNGKCKDEEKVNELFDQYYKKYELKKCPYCQIVTLKNGGCNHITCLYCGKNWCWLCNELFETTEEHYGNIENKCYNEMYPNNENNQNNRNNRLFRCSKCQNETDNYKIFSKCDHIICNNCFENNLLENNYLIIFPDKVMECIITDCNQSILFSNNKLIKFIKDSNNENLKKKYKSQILTNEYFISPFYIEEYGNYVGIISDLIDFIVDNNCKECCRKCQKCIEDYLILTILCYFFMILFLITYITVFCIFPHLAIKKLYYFKFIKEIKEHNNKILLILIIFGEEILFLILIFPLMIIHYIYTYLFLPILAIIYCFRNKIYDYGYDFD